MPRKHRYPCPPGAGSDLIEAGIEKKTPCASRESARLAALESLAILDTPPEPAYDAITRLAADYFEADMAIIGFADETRFWLKSHVNGAFRELPRENSVFDLVLAA